MVGVYEKKQQRKKDWNELILYLFRVSAATPSRVVCCGVHMCLSSKGRKQRINKVSIITILLFHITCFYLWNFFTSM